MLVDKSNRINFLSNNQCVVGIGEVLWDLLPSGKQLGGAPANFAFHVSQLGLDGVVVSAVGNDALGDEVIDVFNSKGLSFLSPRVNFPTGTVNVSIDSKGLPTYDILRDVAWDFIPFSSQLSDLANHSCAVCFGSLAQRSPVSMATIQSFVAAIPKENNPFIIFDINLRQNFFSKEIILQSLNLCNVFKINDEELEVIKRLFSYDSTDLKSVCHDILVDFNLDILILTCGVNGSYIFSDDIVSFLPTPKVDVIDTVGAGDAFTAAFIASMLKGYSICDAHRFAVEVAAYVCSQPGAMPASKHFKI